MKVIPWITLICLLSSCTKENNNPVLDAFPKVLIYDTISIIKNEVYNKSGPLSVYDRKFDEYNITDMQARRWLFDSIKLLNSSVAYSYKFNPGYFGALGYYKIDTFKIVMNEDNFQTVPSHLPDSILILDTKATNDMRVSGNTNEIHSASIVTYVLNGDSFVTQLYAVRVFGGPMGPYSLFGQYGVKKFNLKELYLNLEANQTLSIISYKYFFKVK